MRSIIVCACLAAVPALAAEVAWRKPVEIATGPGVRGPWQQNESRYDYVDDPAVALDERGAAALAWVHQGAKDVFFQRFDANGAALLPPVNVSRSPATFSWLPRVALDPRDSQKVHVLWQEIIFSGGSHGGDMLFARSEDGGASFASPTNLSNSTAGDGKGRINKDVWHNGSYDLTVGPDGTLYAAWTEYEGTLWFTRSKDGGRTFAPLTRIESTHPARGPSIAISEKGAVHVAWTVGENDQADIHLASSTDGGASFGAPRIVEETRGYSDAPKIAVDAQGTLHLVWAESAGGPFEGYRVRYTRSDDGGKRFAPSRPISDAGAAFPSLALDAEGRVAVSWELSKDARRRPRGLGFTASTDAGKTFASPQPIPQSAGPAGYWNGSFQGLLMQKLAMNRAGTIAVVNSALKDNEGSRVWLIRGQSPN